MNCPENEHFLLAKSNQTFAYHHKTYHHHSPSLTTQNYAMWTLTGPQTSHKNITSSLPQLALPLPAKHKTLIVNTILYGAHITFFHYQPITTISILFTSQSYPDTCYKIFFEVEKTCFWLMDSYFDLSFSYDSSQ